MKNAQYRRKRTHTHTHTHTHTRRTALLSSAHVMAYIVLQPECGFKGLPRDLVDGLAKHQHTQMLREIDAFVATVAFAAAASARAEL